MGEGRGKLEALIGDLQAKKAELEKLIQEYDLMLPHLAKARDALDEAGIKDTGPPQPAPQVAAPAPAPAPPPSHRLPALRRLRSLLPNRRRPPNPSSKRNRSLRPPAARSRRWSRRTNRPATKLPTSSATELPCARNGNPGSFSAPG